MDDAFYKQTTLTDIASPKDTVLPIPAKVGPYKIESLLCRGGMSILYLGIHPQTQTTLTIKVLSPEFVAHPEMTKQFLKEAKIIAMTNHPNIVKLYGQGQWEGGLYIAMEFIRGVSLRQFIAQQSLSLKRSIDIVLQVAYALCHLHTHGVIHGDLKPENILITEEGDIKVIDFGIARLTEEIKNIGAKKTKIAGTPSYMSPEQKEDPSKMSFASDIYALGVIAYELFMGKLSYGVIHLSLVPKGLRKILEKALAVSIQQRYQDTVLLISDLSQYLHSGGLEKDRPGSDQLKEVFETIQLAAQSLSPGTSPSWPSSEIGIAKYKGPTQVGSYFDFFKRADQSLIILLAEVAEPSLDGAIYIALLRGMARSVLQSDIQSPTQLTADLNQLISADPIQKTYGAALLYLHPTRDLLSFISCGLGGAVLIPQGSERPRKLTNTNPSLGQHSGAEFFETSHNWDIGDKVIVHSFDSELETPLVEAVAETSLLSAQGQAEAILKKAAAHPSFSSQKNPKTLITIHRLG